MKTKAATKNASTSAAHEVKDARFRAGSVHITDIEEIRNNHKGAYVMCFEMGSYYIAKDGVFRHDLRDVSIWEHDAESVNGSSRIVALYITEEDIGSGMIE